MRVARWFDMHGSERNPGGRDARLLAGVAAWISRFSARRIPSPEPLALSDVPFVLAWLLRQRDRHGRAAVQTYVSQGVRLSRLARDRGIDLTDITLVIGSEPMTPTKYEETVACGATVFLRYFCSELGSVGVGCTDAQHPGDLHLMSDMVALVQPHAEDPAPFLFTSLYEKMPKVMINASLGDCGTAEERDCSCPFGELGFTTHVRDVHSIARVTCEGMTIPVSELCRIIEEVLRPRYGGSTVDYQWVEQEEPGGRSRLRLRVAPSLGDLEPATLVSVVLAGLAQGGRGGRLAADVWDQAGTIGVDRSEPRATASAKTLPFVRE
jgi:hypothetical protein